MKIKQIEYFHALSERYSKLIEIFEGRQATGDDCKHGVKGRGSYTKATTDNAVIIDSLKLKLALADFQAILKEIGKL
jgi:hypothetical protein